MFLAEKTVKNYVSNLLAKLGMERRTQAATFAARLERALGARGPHRRHRHLRRACALYRSGRGGLAAAHGRLAS